MTDSQLSEICNYLIDLLRREDLLKWRHSVAAICNSHADILFGCRFAIEQIALFEQPLQRWPHLTLTRLFVMASATLLENSFTVRLASVFLCQRNG